MHRIFLEYLNSIYDIKPVLSESDIVPESSPKTAPFTAMTAASTAVPVPQENPTMFSTKARSGSAVVTGGTSSLKTTEARSPASFSHGTGSSPSSGASRMSRSSGEHDRGPRSSREDGGFLHSGGVVVGRDDDDDGGWGDGGTIDGLDPTVGVDLDSPGGGGMDLLAVDAAVDSAGGGRKVRGGRIGPSASGKVRCTD